MVGMRAVALAFVLFFFTPLGAFAATLYLSPGSGSYAVGDRITVRVLVATSISANAVSGVLNFSPNTLVIESISKSNSFLSFWVQDPSYSNASAYASFEGVLPGAGYTGTGGTVVTVTFRAKNEGAGSVSFQSGSVLANDGNGTNILEALQGANFTIKAAPVVPVQTVAEPADTAPVATSSLESPVISLGTELLGAREVQVVYGLSRYPESLATLYIGPVSEESLRISTYTAADGSFTIPLPDILKPGAYTVRATIERPTGETPPSNTIPMVVEEGIEAYTRGFIPYFGFAIVLIVLLGAGVVLVGVTRMFTVHRKLTREAREADRAVKKSFDILNEDVDERLRALERVRKESPGAQREALEDLKKDLADAEKYIGKEVDDMTSGKGR